VGRLRSLTGDGGEWARERLSTARVAHLATVTAVGRAHVVPCCFALQGEVVYSAVDAKPKSTQELRRLANVRAYPTASLLVDHYDDDWSALWWVRADGNGRVLTSGDERDAALDILAAKYVQYIEARPTGPVVAIDVSSWSWWTYESGGGGSVGGRGPNQSR
jgi:PPOX class probable F420-dependent enzyme